MTSPRLSLQSEATALKKSRLRILVIDKRSFQVLDILTTLSNAGYFNTYPVLSCVDGLIALREAKKPFDVVLCSTAIDFEELSALLQIASLECLAKYFALVGNTCLEEGRMRSLEALDTLTFRFLGRLKKPLSSAHFGNTLKRVRAPAVDIRPRSCRSEYYDDNSQDFSAKK